MMVLLTDRLKKTVRIPVKVIDGKVQYVLGGNLPSLREGTVGDLIVPAHCVLDQTAIKVMNQKRKVEFLPSKTIVMAHIKPDSLNSKKEGLIPLYMKEIHVYPPQVEGHFASIELQEPLYLRYRGTKQAMLEDCRCKIIALPEQ